VTGDESQFFYQYPFDHMFPANRNKMIPREKGAREAHKVILTILSAV
jgi:hypothetical protein